MATGEGRQFVTDQFGALPAGSEASIRQHIARYCGIEDAGSAASWTLFGVQVPFYRDAWLAYLQRPPIDASHLGTPLFFLVQFRRHSNRVRRLIPIANRAGSIERANRELKVTITEQNLLQYLRFYYMFTPMLDRVAPLTVGPTQYAVPTTIGHLAFKPGEAERISHNARAGKLGCDQECIARGATWRYLDDDTHERFVPLRFKRGNSRVAGRVVIQFEDGVFAVDVKVPASGVPTLSNPELLYQGGLVEPTVLSDRSLPTSDTLSLEQIWRHFKGWAGTSVGKLLRAVRRLISWMITAALAYLWALSALFPILEAFGITFLRGHLEWLSGVFGLQGWPMALLQLTILAIAAFLSIVVYLTNMDKIFNWMFRLLPKSWEKWLARQLNPHMDKRDRDLIALDTFRKRAPMAARLLLTWTGYAVLAFASIQIALNGMFGEQSASAPQILWSLCKQAALNIPVVVYAIIRFPWLFGDIRPVEQGILNPTLLLVFHAVMAVVIVKGILRIWVFTKEATPRAFYRRLRHHR